MSLIRTLYQAARITNNINTLASGNPKRITRRARNIAVGRMLGKFVMWRKL